MKRAQMYLAFLFVLSMIVVPYKASAFFGLEAGIGYWKQSPSGTLSYKSTDNLDLKNDMNLGDKSQVFVRVKAELPLVLPNIYFMATPMSFDGSGTLNRDITYGGQTFNATTPIQSKLKMDHYDLALYYPIPALKTATLGMLNVELGLNARLINFEGTLSQGAISASKSLTLLVPMIYAGIQVKPVSALSIEAEGRGITYSSNHYYDIIGRIKVMLAGPLFIGAGYRSEQIKFDESDVKADTKFSGPFIEAGLSF
ncbi:MAG: TIGR04219 family outer membrane beta-barrel protein [Betaproteobacteria bacterium]